MAVDPREYIAKDKRLPVSLAGDAGKVLVVTPGEDGYEHSEFISVTEATGQIILWPNDKPPEGFLICDGSQYAYDDYPALGAILGASAGQLFNVPDIVFPKNSRGANTLSKESESVGPHTHPLTSVANHNHTLTINSVPDHDHDPSTINVAAADGAHTHSVSIGSAGNHTHSYTKQNLKPAWTPGTNGYSNPGSANTSSAGGHSHSGSASGGAHSHAASSGPTEPAGAHSHTGSLGAAGSHTHTVQTNTGTKTQPECTLITFCIKT